MGQQAHVRRPGFGEIHQRPQGDRNVGTFTRYREAVIAAEFDNRILRDKRHPEHLIAAIAVRRPPPVHAAGLFERLAIEFPNGNSRDVLERAPARNVIVFHPGRGRFIGIRRILRATGRVSTVGRIVENPIPIPANQKRIRILEVGGHAFAVIIAFLEIVGAIHHIVRKHQLVKDARALVITTGHKENRHTGQGQQPTNKTHNILLFFERDSAYKSIIFLEKKEFILAQFYVLRPDFQGARAHSRGL